MTESALPAAPPGFGAEFLDWVRAKTEAAWSVADERTLEDFDPHRGWGTGWRRGTRWIGGYADAEIDSFERREGLSFPDDFRLFLGRLGCTDRPRRCIRYAGRQPVVADVRGFYDWRDESQVAGAREDVVHGLVFDVEQNDLWHAEWGARPATAGDREAVLRRQVAIAPRLAPLFAHRSLVLQPPVAGNPVLSIHQSDVIAYGANLREYLLEELEELGSGHNQDEACGEHKAIPFWGRFLA